MTRTKRLLSSIVGLILLGCAAVAERPAARAASGPIVSFDRAGAPTLTLLDAPRDLTLRASWGGAARSFAFERVGPDARATLAGAPASTDVTYELGTEAGSLGTGTLRTLPSKDEKRWAFAALGDSGRSQGARGPTDEQLAVARLLADLEPDLVLHAGDVVYDPDKEWATAPYFSVPYAATLRRVPFFVALGNHDTPDGTDGAAIRRASAQPPVRAGRGHYYSFDVGAVHFVVLDSNEFEDGGGRALEASHQGQWLLRDLAAATARFRVVVLHHPLYGCKRSRVESPARLRAVLEEAFERGRVDLVIAGHDHHYHRTKPVRQGRADVRGIVHVTTGGGGAALYEGEATELTATFRKVHHLVRVVVEERVLIVDAIAPIGSGRVETIDRFEVRARSD